MKLTRRIKLASLSVVSALTLMLYTSPVMVFASSKADILDGVNDTDPGGPTVNNAISAAITVFSFVVGVAAVIMVIVAGYKYVTSGGDANKVAQAKSTVMYAAIGAALVAIAQIVIRFVLSKAVN